MHGFASLGVQTVSRLNCALVRRVSRPPNFQEFMMPHKIRAAVVALILFAGPSTMSFAEDTKGDGGASKLLCGARYRQHKFNT
jgi:hypothetical protein